MQFLMKCLSILMVTMHLHAHDIYIPKAFLENPIIEHVILISDVDGVVRESIQDIADPRVISAVKSLLENKNVDVTFISGTPIDNDASLEPWRRGNVPLNRVFGSSFEKELSENRVTIFGVLGAHRMKEDGSFEVVDEYPLETSFELTRHLLHAFLKEVQEQGNAEQSAMAKDLVRELATVNLENAEQPTNATATEFRQVVCAIREHFDPEFRVINHGAMVETQTSNPPWKTGLFFPWMQNELDQPQYLTSRLTPMQKQMAAGFAKSTKYAFNYFVISKTNKGLTTKKHIEEKLKKYPNALVITIGDTQVDFPMHRNAHLAFHVGLEKVWHNNPLPQCMVVRNEKGEDAQHIEGTLKVLALLKDAIGKPFFEFKYIPLMDASGNWDYYCLNEL